MSGLPIVLNTTKYEVELPISKKKVEYRPYLVKEEKLLMLAMESQDPNMIMKTVQDIIEACTFNKVKTKTLPTAELELLFLKLRSKSVGETSKIGGPAVAKYVTKKVVLAPGYDSGDLNVYLTAYRPVNTDINVYYKILNRNDTQTFESGKWQLMTKISNSDTLYSPTRNDTYEYVFAPGTNGVGQGYVSYTSSNGQTYTSFSQFAIKVVMLSTDSTQVPIIKDLRVICCA